MDIRRRRQRVVRNRIPKVVIEDPELNKAITRLPANYNFEIHKTVWRIREDKVATVALQFPEGLLMYACAIADILEQFTGCECVILGDVTYGACCIDDLSAKALGCDLLIHYAHSCLVPIVVTAVRVLYVFVEISIDKNHLVECVRQTFTPETRLALMGTIQFAGAVHDACGQLSKTFPSVMVPRAKPLSPGEVLGCTSPVIEDKDALVFVADGRFHLEVIAATIDKAHFRTYNVTSPFLPTVSHMGGGSPYAVATLDIFNKKSAMIHNPGVEHFRYDPYSKLMTKERYDTSKMHSIRRRAIEQAKQAKSFGVILGTLGRQGNPHIVEHVTAMLRNKGKKHFVLLLSEIFPAKLASFGDIDAWVQVACPRLSVDWGHFFEKPLLNSYEANVAMEEITFRERYPMDYYSKGSGPWTNMYEKRVE